MKKVSFFIVVFFCSLQSFSQNIVKTVDIYYLVDTSKVPVLANMWKIDMDYPYKYFTLQCPCLIGGGKPTFLFSMEKKERLITESEMKALNLLSISKFIIIAKDIIKSNSNNYNIFLIEPFEKKYVLHKVMLSNTQKDTAFTDYENITHPDTTRMKH